MTRLLVATSNPAKLAEYRLLLRDSDLEVISLADAAIFEHPAEDGATFSENALRKARFYFGRSGLPTLADDGGLEVDALGGEPGVRSHRWIGGIETSDEMLVAEVIRRMEGVIAHRAWPYIRPGFPYRSVLYLPERRCYVAELGDEEEARISQRRSAVAKLAPELRVLASKER